MSRLRVLDVFAGTGSSTKAFYDAGHDLVYVELDKDLCEQLRKDFPNALVLCMDVKQFAANPTKYLPTGWVPDVLWMSPPCTAFSMAGSGKGRVRWKHAPKGESFQFFGPRFPVHFVSRLGCGLALAALETARKLKALNPRLYWWMENPQGGLMTMGFMDPVPGRIVVTYCQYGDSRMKPTVLWGEWPTTWSPRPRCYNGNPCHVAAKRGSRTGTQGLKGATERSMIPYALGEEILAAVLHDGA